MTTRGGGWVFCQILLRKMSSNMQPQRNSDRPLQFHNHKPLQLSEATVVGRDAEGRIACSQKHGRKNATHDQWAGGRVTSHSIWGAGIELLRLWHTERKTDPEEKGQPSGTRREGSNCVTAEQEKISWGWGKEKKGNGGDIINVPCIYFKCQDGRGRTGR